MKKVTPRENEKAKEKKALLASLKNMKKEAGIDSLKEFILATFKALKKLKMEEEKDPKSPSTHPRDKKKGGKKPL